VPWIRRVMRAHDHENRAATTGEPLPAGDQARTS
jgi:hypothetical protein